MSAGLGAGRTAQKPGSAGCPLEFVPLSTSRTKSGCSECSQFVPKQWLRQSFPPWPLRKHAFCVSALQVCPQAGSSQTKPDLPSISGIVCYFLVNFG